MLSTHWVSASEFLKKFFLLALSIAIGGAVFSVNLFAFVFVLLFLETAQLEIKNMNAKNRAMLRKECFM